MSIAPTLDLSTASRRPWDVAIVGAGPAGALAARELARWGLAVLLIDKSSFPRGKVCGCCLNGRALSILGAVGLGSVTAAGLPLHRAWLSARGGGALLPLPAGVALSRSTLDAALVEAAVQAGADFLPETQASSGECRGSTRALILRRQTSSVEVSARVVLAAGGLGGDFAIGTKARGGVANGSRIGAGMMAASGPAFYEAGTIYLACGHGGYVGLVRVEGGQLDIAAALDPAWIRRAGGPGAAASAILAEAGLSPVAALTDGAWRGTPPLTRHAGRLAAERLFVLGDAAGYVEPFTGEGIGWALASAVAVVPLVVRGVRRWEPALAGQWDRVYRQTVAGRQLSCRALAALLRRPRLTRGLIFLLAYLPRLAEPVVRRFHLPPRHSRREPSLVAPARH